MTGAALVVQGDALHLPLPDASVDAIITSPPYWALRAYQAGPGEIGSEPTPQAFLEALWAATAEMMRCLKPTGSAFINLGDKYSSAAGPQTGQASRQLQANGKPSGPKWPTQSRGARVEGVPSKSLMLLPERYRIGCVDRLGLIARAVIVWDKPNGLPESVQDRVRRSHEDWVHLVKQPRYYSALDEVREPHSAEASGRRELYGRNGRGTETSVQAVRHDSGENGVMGFSANPLGKLPGSVWTIPSEPLRLPEHLGVQHYAAFPSEWPRRLILGFSPPGICLDCGQGRVPVVERTEETANAPLLGGDAFTAYGARPHERRVRTATGYSYPSTRGAILGYACSCTPYTDHPGTGESSGPHGIAGNDPRAGNGYEGTGQGQNWGGKQHLADRPKTGPWREYHLERWQPPPTRPAVVVDVFGGTGTTALVARALDRIGISLDLSWDYSRLAKWRIFHSGDSGKALSRTWKERQGSLLNDAPSAEGS